MMPEAPIVTNLACKDTSSLYVEWENNPTAPGTDLTLYRAFVILFDDSISYSIELWHLALYSNLLMHDGEKKTKSC